MQPIIASHGDGPDDSRLFAQIEDGFLLIFADEAVTPLVEQKVNVGEDDG